MTGYQSGLLKRFLRIIVRSTAALSVVGAVVAMQMLIEWMDGGICCSRWQYILFNINAL